MSSVFLTSPPPSYHVRENLSLNLELKTDLARLVHQEASEVFCFWLPTSWIIIALIYTKICGSELLSSCSYN